jgi:hypothetical protein
MPPLPLDITTVIFIALTIFVLWRVPLSVREDQESRGASKLSPLEIRKSVLWFGVFFAVLTLVTYCQRTQAS